MKTFANISLRFEDVSTSRGDRTLFSNVSFTLNSGELIWIEGENGIGKTTLLRLATGLAKPDEGRISWERNGIQSPASEIATYQAHRNALKKQLSVIEDLKFWARQYRYSEDPADLLERINLTDCRDLKCHHLSAGQGRRLAIARLLVSQRPLWIMDEPAAAMDVSGQNLILDVINSHIANGGAALVASHDSIRAFDVPTSVLRLSTT